MADAKLGEHSTGFREPYSTTNLINRWVRRLVCPSVFRQDQSPKRIDCLSPHTKISNREPLPDCNVVAQDRKSKCRDQSPAVVQSKILTTEYMFGQRARISQRLSSFGAQIRSALHAIADLGAKMGVTDSKTDLSRLAKCSKVQRAGFTKQANLGLARPDPSPRSEKLSLPRRIIQIQSTCAKGLVDNLA